MIDSFAVVFADWHRHHFSRGGHSPSGDDSLLGIFVVSLALMVTVAFFVDLVGGLIVLVLTRKARNLFWAIPGVNLLLYAAMVLLRPYPGGCEAQFVFPGIVFTVIELFILLAVSLFLAVVLALLYRILCKRSRPSEAKKEPINLD